MRTSSTTRAPSPEVGLTTRQSWAPHNPPQFIPRELSGQVRSKLGLGLLIAALLLPASFTKAQNRQEQESDEALTQLPNDRSLFPLLIRTIDGTYNNLRHHDWGAAETPFLRFTSVGYADGASEPSGADRPNARLISTFVCDQEAEVENARGASDFIWQWGQFLDHDIDETPLIDPAEPFNIAVPTGDPFFDPFGTGEEVIALDRSFYEEVDGVREQVNFITSYIDASNVYGSDEERANALRTLDGTGRLQTSDGDLLPFNTEGFPNAPSDRIPTFFLAGDVRANEQIALTAMHTLFVREHNFWAEKIGDTFGRQRPRASDGESEESLGESGDEREREFQRRRQRHGLTGNQIYQMARIIVAAEMQAITYNEFLPVLLGRDALPEYDGYDREQPAGITNVFAAAAYRVGHTMLSPTLQRIDADGNEAPEGSIALRDAFFNPQEIIDNDIDSILRGLASQPAQEIDTRIIDDVRNFLFGPPGAGGFDLASLNIQRGRDHGLPGYNQVRRDFFLPSRTSFEEISSDPETVSRLRAVYGSVEEIDIWVGGLAEDHVEGAMVGETLRTILTEQFTALRDGDRFYYERYLPRSMQRLIEEQTLARIIRRNTNIGREFPRNPFLISDEEPGDGGSNNRPRKPENRRPRPGERLPMRPDLIDPMMNDRPSW